MRSPYHLLGAAAFFLFTSVWARAQDCRSAASGNWHTLSTWEQSTDGGTTWGPAAAIPNNVSGAISIQAPHTVALSTSLTLNSVLTNNGTINWTGGQISGSGNFQNTSGAVFNIGFTATDQLGVPLTNQAGGTVNQNGTGTFSTYQWSAAGTFTNAGTINLVNGNWLTQQAFHNSGTIHIPSGRLITFNYTTNLNTGTTFTGTGAITSGSTTNQNFPWTNTTHALTISGGTWTNASGQPLVFGLGSSFNWTEGTLAGTGLVRDIHPGTNSSLPSNFIEHNGQLHLRAFPTTLGNSAAWIWKSDGTQAGTVSLPTFGYTDPDNLCSPEGRIHFTAIGSTTYRQLWRTDGTAAGTNEILFPASDVISPFSGATALLSCSGALFFRANYLTSTGLELYALDLTTGTEAHTEEVAHVFPDPATDHLVVQLTRPTSARLFDNSGRVVRSWRLTAGSNAVDLAGLETGAYMLVAEAGTHRIMKQ